MADSTSSVTVKMSAAEMGAYGNVKWRQVEVAYERIQREQPQLPQHLERDKIEAIAEAYVKVEAARARGHGTNGGYGYYTHLRWLAGLSGCTIPEVQTLLRLAKQYLF